MNPFKDHTIEKRMMALVKNVIAEGQKAFDAAIKSSEDILEAQIETLKHNHELDKVSLADQMVKEAFAKLK